MAALERACRSFSLTAVERILAAQARLRSVPGLHLAAVVGVQPVPPRSTAEYLHLLEPSTPEPYPHRL